MRRGIRSAQKGQAKWNWTLKRLIVFDNFGRTWNSLLHKRGGHNEGNALKRKLVLFDNCDRTWNSLHERVGII